MVPGIESFRDKFKDYTDYYTIIGGSACDILLTEASMNPLTLNEQSTLNYYNNKATEFVSGTVEVQFIEMQDTFLKYVPAGGKILDFGCGSGRDTKYFLSRGYAVEATDGSEELCKIASEYTGISVKKMLFHELNSVGEYDGIWACASILHVAKQELPMIIQKMADAVKDGGAVYMSFKYGEFEGVKNGRYFTYLTEGAFEKLIEQIPKLRVEKLWVTTDVRADRDEERWLNVILRRR